MGRKRVVSFLDLATMARAKADLKGLPQSRVTLRLLAIIAARQDSKLGDVASFFNTTRQTLAVWISRYRLRGLDGLANLPKGHRRARLSRNQAKAIQRWIESGKAPSGQPVHWTIALLREAIRDTFGVTLGKTRVWLLLREWGYRLKVPRPRHAKASPKAEKTFKKNSAAP